ncbi:hypothetical protein V490_01643 [Pseudogymnoascus sp. VKM F-3557]|nr:hypothetical protein V490_01643 [Pseudogymnoascus sp. VKM F-3557]
MSVLQFAQALFPSFWQGSEPEVQFAQVDKSTEVALIVLRRSDAWTIGLSAGMASDDNWTVDSADVFVRSGPNGMNRFAPWGPTRTKEIDAATTPKDEAPPLETQILFPHPLHSLPVPELVFDFRMSIKHSPYVRLGTSSAEIKNWIPINGGTWSGTFGSGTVVPGGHAIHKVHNPSYVSELTMDYLLQTTDEPPAMIAVHVDANRTGPVEVLKQLRPVCQEGVDPRRYRFRLSLKMQTDDERYAENLNFGMWVGSGVKNAEEFVFDLYKVQ